MKHVFIINPSAGKNHNALQCIPEIEDFFAAHKEFGEPIIVQTESHGHATLLAEEYAASGEPVRLYTAGGDGTVAEVLHGMYRYPNAQLAILPCGSGNDYVRTFPDRNFRNIAALVTGDTHQVDLLRCNNGLSLNIACMGLDADVASKMTKYKHWPLVSGSMAYNLALIDVFCHRIGKQLSITIDTLHGEVTREGRYFFALAASGQYYGGGYHGAPTAQPDDGILDFVLVRSMSRVRMLTILSKYKNGEHLSLPEVEHFRGTAMRVHCEEGAVVALDGECFTQNDMSFSLCDEKVNFVLPSKAVVKDRIFENAPKAVKGKAVHAAFVKKL